MNFYGYTSHSFLRFNEYKIESINGKKYIVADRKKTHKFHWFEEDEIEGCMLDLLNIGKLVFFNVMPAEEKVIEFVNKYGLLGFMHDFACDKYYLFHDKVVLKEFNYIVYKDYVSSISIEEYLKIFMPKVENINELIEGYKKIDINSHCMEKFFNEVINDNTIANVEYAEEMDMFLKYARDMYEITYALQSDGTEYLHTKLEEFEVNHLKYALDYSKNTHIRYKVYYLKQVIDLLFADIVSKQVNLLKTCKYCGNAFVANNPKAEYDSLACKNKANVYKSRAKIKDSNEN